MVSEAAEGLSPAVSLITYHKYRAEGSTTGRETGLSVLKKVDLGNHDWYGKNITPVLPNRRLGTIK